MEIKENVTVYKCSFCSKPNPYFSKYHCGQHEKKCGANPINHRPCLNGCIHLKRVEIEYNSGYEDYHLGESIMKKGEAFQCGLSLELMLHPKIVNKYNGEGLRWVKINEDEDVKQIDMPIECKDMTTGAEFDLW